VITPFLKRFSLDRPITSYNRVRKLVGLLIRNAPTQARGVREAYLNAGCGPNPIKRNGFINLDYNWEPGIFCWDLSVKLPFPDKRLLGIYSEHCLEHIPRETLRKVLAEFYRLLRPGQTLRIVVPDVEIYVDLYNRHRQGEIVKPPYEEDKTALDGLNRIMRDHGHQYAYDFETMKQMLNEAGFTSVTKRSFRKGRDPHLCLDSPEREPESLYIDAYTPHFGW
jgi:predicted SAM-dependent methyltransferase